MSATLESASRLGGDWELGLVLEFGEWDLDCAQATRPMAGATAPAECLADARSYVVLARLRQ